MLKGSAAFKPAVQRSIALKKQARRQPPRGPVDGAGTWPTVRLRGVRYR